MIEHGGPWKIYGNKSAVDRFRRDAVRGARHAYLISGPDFVGKALVARTFAAALLCTSPNGADIPCGECSACRRIGRGVHPDVMTFDLAYQAVQDETKSRNLTLNIKTVREIGRHVALRPAESNWRVVIVDDIESMQEPAQEAFLKTLEEPPGYAVIILLSTDAESLLPTLRSRCAIVPMAPVRSDQVRQALLDKGAKDTIADRLSGSARGRVGLALRALEDSSVYDRLIAIGDTAGRWIGTDEYGRMVEAFRLADQFASSRDVVFDHLLAAEAEWRDLVLLASGAAVSTGSFSSGEQPAITVEDGVRALGAIDRCLRDLEANVRPRSALATMVQQWPRAVGSRP